MYEVCLNVACMGKKSTAKKHEESEVKSIKATCSRVKFVSHL